jgi:hypothetical protein
MDQLCFQRYHSSIIQYIVFPSIPSPAILSSSKASFEYAHDHHSHDPFTISRLVLRNELLHSSYALPAPNPNPTIAGHARRLKRRTENTTPNERPRDERIKREERQRSHWFSCVRVDILAIEIVVERKWGGVGYLFVQKSFAHGLAGASHWRRRRD